MSEDRLGRAKEIFGRALELLPEARRAFLAEACAGDASLREEVASLLDSDAGTGGFLEKPPLGAGISIATLLGPVEPGEIAGTRIGAYRLERLIGAGGMGSVFLATGLDGDAERQVAIKIIRQDLQLDLAVSYLSRERQALERLVHPGITRLLGGGTTEQGLPYLVMEYVAGTPITEYCDAHHLDTQPRLALFVAVCDTVQYAHRNLILHRDLKPDNILVTESGIPKLLDFGIARLLQPENSSASLAAPATTQRMFTPDYASPEQVRGKSVSTATDVYSLGVILYELLSGHRPYRVGRLSPREIERTICEDDPPRPSTSIARVERVTTRGGVVELSPAGVSAARGSSPERLRRHLRGDLDQIVLKAMRKEPEQRYGSVELLAGDIRRYLAGRPILARKGTLRYRASRFVARHRGVVASASLLLLALAGAGLLGLWEWRRMRNQQAARQVGGFIAEMARAKWTAPESVLETLRERGAERLADDLSEQPEELRGYAESIAQVLESLHLDREAARWRERVVRACEKSRSAGAEQRAEALYRLAAARFRAGEFESAGTALEGLAREPDSPSGLAGTEARRARVRHLRALVAWWTGRFADANVYFREAVGRLAQEPTIPAREQGALLLDFARFLEMSGAFEAGFACVRDARVLAAGLRGEERPILEASIDHEEARLLWCTPRFRRAEPLLRSALARLLADLPAEDARVASLMNDLGLVLRRTRGETSSAEDDPGLALWSAALEWRRRNLGETSLEVADSMETLAQMLPRSELEPHARAALARTRALLGSDHPHLARPLAALGAALLGKETPGLGEARLCFERALEILHAGFPRGHWLEAEVGGHLGVLRALEGDCQESESLVLRAVESLRARVGSDHPDTVDAEGRAVLSYEICGRPDLAARFEERFASAGRWRLGPSFRDTDDTRERYAPLDFEDDLLEKVIVASLDATSASSARLWVYGQAYNFGWESFHPQEEFRIRVNHDPAREIRFSVGPTFANLTGFFQWVSFDIPIRWLIEGANVFTIYEAHDPRWRETSPWSFNNLRVGIDTGSDRDRSWWYGAAGSCCESMQRSAMKAEKDRPFAPDHALIEAHRRQGAAECTGELMIFLELSPD